MQFRIKSEEEMSKPYGKCIRFLEYLQFISFQKLEPTNDPKWFRRSPLTAIPFTKDAPPLVSTGSYLTGRVINKGCVSCPIVKLPDGSWTDPLYVGWYFDIEWNGYKYSVPQNIVDVPMKYGDYKLTAREFYENTEPADDRAKLLTDKLIEVYEAEMKRDIGGDWDPLLRRSVISKFEQAKDLITI